MFKNDLTIVIFGKICQDKSKQLNSFWSGFIELQRRIPNNKIVRQLICHSWNPELAELVKVVYAPLIELHEQTEESNPPQLNRSTSNGLLDANNINLKVKIDKEANNLIIMNANSRSRAIRLMSKVPDKSEQVLIVNWNIGQTESSVTYPLIFDSSLPNEYMYLSNSDDIDNGYPDKWIIAPWNIALYFEKYALFAYESIIGTNQYLDLRTKIGWPRSRIKMKYQIITSHPILQNALKRLNQSLQNFLSRPLEGLWKSQLRRVINKITILLKKKIDKTKLSAENSFINRTNNKLLTFSAESIINAESILKYFVISHGLRERTRFLKDNDFEISLLCGKLINPQNIILIIVEDDSKKIETILTESPLPLIAVYQLKNNEVYEYVRSVNNDWRCQLIQTNSIDLKDQIICGLNEANKKISNKIPVLVIPAAEVYMKCLDWYYLNALFKYISWENCSYISLDSDKIGEKNIEFPNLRIVKNTQYLSIQKIAGCVEGLLEVLKNTIPTKSGLDEFENRKLKNYLVVSEGKKLF
jgi:hypothetical protein